MITLNNLHPHQRRTKYKRVGRGNASGKGTTAGRGTKGQRARTGGRNKLTRRGLAHLITRTPKYRGFRSARLVLPVLTLAELSRHFPDNSSINTASLIKRGLLSKKTSGFKVIGRWELKKKFQIYARAYSKSAADSISQAGGTAHLISSQPKPDTTK